MKAKSSS